MEPKKYFERLKKEKTIHTLTKKKPVWIANRYDMQGGKFVIIKTRRLLTIPEMQGIIEKWLIKEKEEVGKRFLRSSGMVIVWPD